MSYLAPHQEGQFDSETSNTLTAILVMVICKVELGQMDFSCLLKKPLTCVPIPATARLHTT